MASDQSSIETTPRLLSARALAHQLSTSVATIWRWDASGKLPPPLRITPGTTRWRRKDIALWISLDCPDRKTFEASENNRPHPTQ